MKKIMVDDKDNKRTCEIEFFLILTRMTLDKEGERKTEKNIGQSPPSCDPPEIEPAA